MSVIKRRARYLKKLYYNVGEESGLGSVDKLYRATKREAKFKFTKAQIKDFLKGEDTYTLHKPARKNHPRNKVIAVGRNEIHQLDLVDVSSISKHNNGNKFLLTWINVFSKFAWVIALKNKTGKMLVEAYKIFLEAGDNLLCITRIKVANL